MTLSFRQRLKKGDTLIGSLLQMPLPESAEIFVQAGYDWLFVDMEHSPMDARAALNILTAVVSRCKYPPVGIRSVGITRAQRYDLTFDDYMQRANEEIAVIVQIEHVKAV